MSRPIRVAILGATGYGAGELLRLFTQHPAVEVVSVTSTSRGGEPIPAVHPHLAGFYDLVVSERVNRERLLGGEQAVIFSALPNGASATALDALLHELGDERVKAIDLSGDLRVKDDEQHRAAYPESPSLPDRRTAFVYGLPELFREKITAARFVANPGCLATAAILAGAPLLAEKPTDGHPSASAAGMVVIDAKTGSSGAGRTLKETTHHPTRHADFRAYKPLAHPHLPEIAQAWGDARGERLQISFVPHSLPVARGIFATVYVTLPREATAAELSERYRHYYAGSPFVRVADESPALQNVVGSNFCDVSVACRGRQVVAMAALDNLVKGMAGAAIQNMNLMCGLPETTGLWTPSLRPV